MQATEPGTGLGPSAGPGPGPAPASGCKCANEGKTCAKFALLWFACLTFTVLIFTSFNKEKTNKLQTKWWWALLVSLFATTGTTLTVLIVALHVDRNYFVETPEQKAIADFKVEASPPPATSPDTNDPGYSSSFKTVLTINSALMPAADQEENQEKPFPRLPSPTVRVVDMRRNIARPNSTWSPGPKSPNQGSPQKLNQLKVSGLKLKAKKKR